MSRGNYILARIYSQMHKTTVYCATIMWLSFGKRITFPLESRKTRGRTTYLPTHINTFPLVTILLARIPLLRVIMEVRNNINTNVYH
jgi:hypothetical protein